MKLNIRAAQHVFNQNKQSYLLYIYIQQLGFAQKKTLVHVFDMYLLQARRELLLLHVLLLGCKSTANKYIYETTHVSKSFRWHATRVCVIKLFHGTRELVDAASKPSTNPMSPTTHGYVTRTKFKRKSLHNFDHYHPYSVFLK